MNLRRGRVTVLSVLLAGVALSTTATPVAAECTQLDRWPSFTEAAPSAKRIIVGEVVESYFDDSADNAITFRMRVDEVLRGRSRRALEFRDVVRSGAPLTICPGDSILRVRVGDILAFAFDARVASSPDPVLAVAWIRGTPDDFLMPGAERLTLAEVRSLAALPATDTALPSEERERSIPMIPLLAAGLLGALVRLLRVQPKPS